MGLVFARNAWKMIAVVLAGIAVVAMVGCQWQMAALDQTETCLPTHHRAPASPATADLHCPGGISCAGGSRSAVYHSAHGASHRVCVSSLYSS